MASYVTAAEVKAGAPTIQWSTIYDSLLPVLIERASQLVDKLTRREIGAYDASDSATERWFNAEGGKHLAIDECVEVTAVAVRRGTGLTETAFASTDYVTWPYSASAAIGPIIRLDIDDRQGSYDVWPVGKEAVGVTAKWGYSADPPGIVEQAVIVAVVRWIKRGEQMYADASLVAAAGRLLYAQGLDPTVKVLLFDSGLMKKQDLF